MVADLDPSWRLLLSLDLLNGAQAGKDLVFTYGPLGSLLTQSGPYVAETHWLKFFAELLAKGLVALAFTRLLLRFPSPWLRFTTFGVLLALVPWDFDAVYYLAITAACLRALTDKDKPLSGVLVAALIAPLGMVKFTFAVMGAASLSLLALGKAFQGRFLASLLIPISFVLSFLAVWLGIGQSLGNLPLYIKGSMEISKGYNQAMFLMGDPGLLKIGALAFLSFVAWLLWSWWRGKRDPFRTILVLLLLAPGFLCWKAGFVRQDFGHTLVFFSTIVVLPLWGLGLLAQNPSPSRKNIAIPVLALLPMCLGFLGIGIAGGEIGWRLPELIPQLRYRASLNRSSLLHPFAWEQALARRQKEEERKNALPRIQSMVGKEACDELPHTAAILYLNHLRIRHRPVFQSYSAYNPYLQKLNGDFFESNRAPQFVLLNPLGIDGKMALQADSQAYRVLLRRYVPVGGEKGWLLLKRRENAGSLPKISGQPFAKPTRSGRAGLNQWVDLPEGPGMGELSIHLAPSLLGKLRTLVFRPPLLTLDLRDPKGNIQSFTSPAPSMRLPFLVDPTVWTTSDFLDLYFGKVQKRVVAFRLRVRRGKEYAFASRMDWSYRRSPFPSSKGIPESLRKKRWKLAFPLLPLPPLSMEPPKHFWNTGAEEKKVLLAHPRSRLVFKLPKGSFHFRAGYGMVKGSYTGKGMSDGVTFRISLRKGSAPPKILYERRLEPKTRAEDRGLQKLNLSIACETEAALILETLPGPTDSWDWSFWTEMSLEPKQSK